MYTAFELLAREFYSDDLTILIKFPSRSRPEKLVDTFQKYISLASNTSLISVLISLDKDDSTVSTELIQRLKSIHPSTQVHVGEPCGKIGAINRDMEEAGPYDILLLASDDMIPVQYGYDKLIRNHMKNYYPDLDGVLWYNDGFKGPLLNTLCILGKTYYNRFGYIYHSSYKSLYCDNEFMDVAKRLGKQTYIDHVIIKHEHPLATGQERDALYQVNQTFVQTDFHNFLDRRSKGFPSF